MSASGFRLDYSIFLLSFFPAEPSIGGDLWWCVSSLLQRESWRFGNVPSRCWPGISATSAGIIRVSGRSSSTIADWNSFAHSPVDLWFDWVAHQMFPTQRTDEERISYLRTVYPLPALSWNWLAFYETRPYSSSSPSPSSSCNILSCALYGVSFCGSPCRLHPRIVQLSEHQDTV